MKKYLEKAVRQLDKEDVNIENFRIRLYQAFEFKMKEEIKRIDTCGIRREEIKSTYMNLMLKRYCINSVFNLGLLSIVENSWLESTDSTSRN